MKPANRTVFFILCFICLKQMYAQQVSISEAVNAARYVMREETRSYPTVDSVWYKAVNGDTLLYEIHFNNGNSVLLSGHKGCLPVLGIFDEPFIGIINNPNSIVDGLSLYMNWYESQIQHCFQNDIPLYYQLEWDSLQMSNPNREVRRKVGPLISTKWGQSSSNDNWHDAYNYYIIRIPQYCNQTCYTGCVATATAQVMKYWNEPQEIPDTCIQYDWDNMPNELIKTDNPNYELQRNAVARLLAEVGQKLNTQYCNNSCKSSAYEWDVPIALKSYGYNHAHVVYKNSYQGDWENLIRAEINSNRPMVYVGLDTLANPISRHAFVCDGYRKILCSGYKYHFNWGWEGTSQDRQNCWLTVGKITPEGHDYTLNQCAVINIYPENCWENIIFKCDKEISNSLKIYNSKNTIKTNGYDFIIDSNAVAILQAGNEIVFSDGFHSKRGSMLVAGIGMCDSLSDERESEADTENNGDNSLEENDWKSIEPHPYIKLFPNPAKDIVNIVSDVILKNVQIYNLYGNMLLQKHVNENNAMISISGLPSGVYIMRIFHQEGLEIRKIIKQ